MSHKTAYLAFQASSKIDLEATRERLENNSDIIFKRKSEGGRGGGDHDCGNLIFWCDSLPGWKFQVSRRGIIQIYLPDRPVNCNPVDLLWKLSLWLVPDREEGANVALEYWEEDTVELAVVENTYIPIEPLPAQPKLLPVLSNNESTPTHLSDRERQIQFYTEMLSNIREDFCFVQRILEVLKSGKKGVVFDKDSFFEPMLRHKSEIIFLGEWTDGEKLQFFEAYRRRNSEQIIDIFKDCVDDSMPDYEIVSF